MKIRRRMTFQLTPLLDLLLIVIFAQYMEVRQTAESAQGQLQEQKQQLVDEFSAREAELAATKAELDRELANQKMGLAETRQRYSDQFESIVKQHQQVGQALATAFNLPGAVMEEVLKLKTDGRSTDASNLEKAVERLKRILPERGTEMLQFVLKYDEMQKHVSVWELHLQDNGQAMFSDGEQSATVVFGTTDEFVDRLFQASKAFTEPKPLVIVLLTYGDAQAVQRRRAVEGMPLLVEKLRRDSGNTRWFDFSLMGFRPEGPLFEQVQKKP
ncbi:MAG: hypothetical protein R3C59_18725 [Planctomycetaceae bacterium]